MFTVKIRCLVCGKLKRFELKQNSQQQLSKTEESEESGEEEEND